MVNFGAFRNNFGPKQLNFSSSFFICYILFSNRLAAFVKGCVLFDNFWCFVILKIKRQEVSNMAPIKGSPMDCNNGNQGHRDAMLLLEHQRRMDDLRRGEVR